MDLLSRSKNASATSTVFDELKLLWPSRGSKNTLLTVFFRSKNTTTNLSSRKNPPKYEMRTQFLKNSTRKTWNRNETLLELETIKISPRTSKRRPKTYLEQSLLILDDLAEVKHLVLNQKLCKNHVDKTLLSVFVGLGFAEIKYKKKNLRMAELFSDSALTFSWRTLTI